VWAVNGLPRTATDFPTRRRIFFSGEDVDRPRALDGIVGRIGIETGIGRKPQNVRFLRPSGSISCPADCKLSLGGLSLDVRFQALGGG
jgi:hypothetical protein